MTQVLGYQFPLVKEFHNCKVEVTSLATDPILGLVLDIDWGIQKDKVFQSKSFH